MATLQDIDVQSLVSKYLRRQTVNNALDETADGSAEVQALIESVALSFLLFPQAALSMVMRAKNTLQQVVKTDLDIVNFMVGCVRDASNPDEPIADSSDLVEAQTALIELDQLGRVSSDLPSYGRYQAAVGRFLNQQLASSLKRHQRNEFERSGTEARQDLFAILPSFTATHQVMATRLQQLAASVSDFSGLNLAQLVSTKTLTRVRSSLQQLRTAVDQGAASKTVVALELLAGAAALQSISGSRGAYDATVETSRAIPDGRTIVVDSVGNQAFSVSEDGPWSSVVGTFELTVNPLNLAGLSYHAVVLPAAGGAGKAYVTSSGGTPTYNVPAGYKLYVLLDGTTTVQVTLTTGASVPFATLVADIDAAVTGSGGRCVEFYPGSNRFLVWSTTSVVILDSGSGSVSGGGIYTAPAASAHTILGFLGHQTSLPAGSFTAESLRDILAGNIPQATFVVEDNARLRVTSNSEEATSSLLFGGVASDFGFPATTIGALPDGLLLREGATFLDPAELGIFVGSRVSVTESPSVGTRNISALVVNIDDTGGTPILVFDVPVPRGIGMSVTILAPIVVAVQELVRSISELVGTFDKDSFNLQKVLSPVFSRATLAQTNDALVVLNAIKARLTLFLAILSSISVRDDRSQFSSLARDLTDGLTERGLDRGVVILSSAQFSTFFAVSKDAASRSSRFLLAMNTVVQTDFPPTLVEQDMDDGTRAAGSNPNTDVLPGLEPSA